jgi:transcription antitermination factor NusA-like protein
LAKVKSGEITRLDLRIARLLLSLEDKYPSLQNIYFHKAVDVDNTLAVIVGRSDVPRLLGYGGKIVKAMGAKVGKAIRILEYGVDDRKFLEDLFAPVSIVAINTIWLPDGTTEIRVILRKRRGRQPPFDVKALKEIACKVRNMTLRVEFAD